MSINENNANNANNANNESYVDNKNGDVWVYIEQDEGQISDVSLELITKACELAARLHSKVGAVLLGHGVEKLSQTLFSYGVDIVYLVEDEVLFRYTTAPYARTVIELAKTYKPEIFLIGASLLGRDLAPRISAGLSCGLTADCTELHIEDLVYRKKEYKNLLLQIRPAFGGNIVATIITPTARPQMASVRDGVMLMRTPDPSRIAKGEVIRHAFKSHSRDGAITILERVKYAQKVNLKKSDVIVAVGAGIGNVENFKIAQQVASLLGGQVGASRAAVEKGFISRDYQIGQTGVTVRPKLYIACGISGAIQHRTGMSQSDMIIVFNNNPNAPILKIAHHAVIGDLNQTLPVFLNSLKGV